MRGFGIPALAEIPLGLMAAGTRPRRPGRNLWMTGGVTELVSSGRSSVRTGWTSPGPGGRLRI
jgi:hypothetical protein